MPEAVNANAPREHYPFPWSMHEPEAKRKPPMQARAAGVLDDVDNPLRKWLLSFCDERNGGSCPPPMS